MSTDPVGGTPETTNSQYFVADSATGGNTGAETVQGILDIVLASNINEQTNYVSQLAGQVNELNIKMANDNAAEATANTCASSGSCNRNTTFAYTDPTTGKTSQMTVSQYCKDQGISSPTTIVDETAKQAWDSGNLNHMEHWAEDKNKGDTDQDLWNTSEWSTVANNLQTNCSTLSNDAQLLNVDLQTGMNNLSNTNQLLSTVNKSFTDTNADIIRNV